MERRQSKSRSKPSAVTPNNPVWRAMLCAPFSSWVVAVCPGLAVWAVLQPPLHKRLRLWRLRLRKEAARDAQEEPLLSSFLYAALLSHDTFERSLAFVLANRLSDPTLLATVRIAGASAHRSACAVFNHCASSAARLMANQTR